MSRDVISPEGLRQDGRRPPEIRKLACQLGQFRKVDGSATFEQGNTKVIATVYGPREAKQRSKALHDRCFITCEYSVAGFARGERKKLAKGDRRGKENGLLIKQTFEECVLCHLYPRSQISIFVQVLADDGGALAAALSAASLALINAGIAMKDFVSACTVGFVDGQPILDINSLERSFGGASMTVAFYPQSEKVALVQMESRMALANFEDVLALGSEGCKKVYEVLKGKVKDYSCDILHTRGFLAS